MITDARSVDTHCHIDAYPDPRSVLTDARRERVHIIAVTEDPSAFKRLRTRLGPAPGVTVALGLHPLAREAKRSGQVDRFLRMVPEAAWIGEIGLDFSAHVPQQERHHQLANLERLLADEKVRRVPMTVHSRGAASETVNLLAQAGAKAVLHWFTGSLGIAERAVDDGLYFSVNPAMLRSDRGKRLIRLLPRERVLLESDGPYCRTQGRPVLPVDILSVLRAVAREWEVSERDASALVAENLSRLIGNGSH